MADVIGEVQKLTSGHNNAAAAKPFPLISPPLFYGYPTAITQRWRGYIGKQLTGAMLDRTWGKPRLDLTFGVLTRAEYVLLRAFIGAVTLYCLNEDTNTWGYYSANLRSLTAGDFNKDNGTYRDVTAEFIYLVAL